LKSVEEIAMFMDVVVFAGIGTVALMIAFFVGLYYFVRKEEQKRN
jgi:flagellar biogenesis protein FliO